MTNRCKLFLLTVFITSVRCSQPNDGVMQSEAIPPPPEDKAALQLELGEELYTRCTSCHSPAYNRTGPKHCGLLGRKIGSVEDYDYSDAMKSMDTVWTRKNLDVFIESPVRYIPGTTMGIIGISSASDRAVLIDYLAELTIENPECQQDPMDQEMQSKVTPTDNLPVETLPADVSPADVSPADPSPKQATPTN